MNFERKTLPACRRLVFPLLHAEKERLRNAVANRVPASRWVPKILGTCCDRLTHSPRATKEIGDVCTQATKNTDHAFSD